jgi:hypothetical protein
MDFHFKDLAYVFEFLAFCFSFLCFKKGQPRPMRLFPFILTVVIVTELVAAIMRYTVRSNGEVYNYFILFWFPSYLMIFYLWLEKERNKKVILIFTGLFFLVAGWDFFTYGIDHWIVHRTFIFGSCCLVVSSVFALWELTNKKVPVLLSLHPLFWFSLSVLAYFLPISILMSANEYIKGIVNPDGNAFARAYMKVNTVFIIIHYSLLCIVFSVRYVEEYQKRKASSRPI